MTGMLGNEPGGETAAQRTSTSMRRTRQGPGGHGASGTSRRSSRQIGTTNKVIGGGGNNEIHLRSEENERDVETKAQSRDTVPGSCRGEQAKSGGAEDNRRRQSDGGGDIHDGKQTAERAERVASRNDSVILHHVPDTPNRLPTMSTHHVDEDDSTGVDRGPPRAS
ncbi:hypothetical protein OG21DRAFT_1524115 [Imleria badia]|nr:hypothetical protein OG21DRAFT_1524115 [Imleria badia]